MNELQQTNTLPVTTAQNIELSATSPDEIGQAQQALIHWAKAKVQEMRLEYDEVDAAFKNAVEHKWSSAPLKRQCEKCQKRIEFYSKVLSALEHGFVIIPNFPVTVFAIRTDKAKPLKMLSTYWGASHEQSPPSLPESEGEYKNPFPQVFQRTLPNETKEFWCEEWKDLEFPLTMAKANIIEVTSRAMALKLFDDFGIMPERKREDPIIVGRLRDPRSTKYNRRVVTFMVAWHLNTRDL